MAIYHLCSNVAEVSEISTGFLMLPRFSDRFVSAPATSVARTMIASIIGDV